MIFGNLYIINERNISIIVPIQIASKKLLRFLNIFLFLQMTRIGIDIKMYNKIFKAKDITLIFDIV